MKETRTEVVALRLSATELQVVNELVQFTGLNTSDILRQALRTVHAARFEKVTQRKAQRSPQAKVKG